ncbi:ABC transporter substrate-binding protein [Oharaeibacter diazotrophicus]|uniref:Amino acid/amide ABC transporter substrate-binding protein (HAAT family) n=1 Tax=Oharaeibacter diazotrophicus TaxID=1920512 RepID=A0A4R6RHK5_9HYPH|nr:ABC transporter substrate-binding protein [Oharaeibacter diazotrophicus]TDP85317.1 amino acid/amide ABC transporter substrate-binding protein (HAAT family) [Oharaeibacter diazotrophicus]BBE74288.1 hypothetical protein OHA_1_03918 [Pleomorphomonas sp. SM30]GLS76022.1 ABC transporter substrate-binding protein [Oharaeibacter diazotrophicus]
MELLNRGATRLAAVLVAATTTLAAPAARAEDPATISVGYIQWGVPRATLSIVDLPTPDRGVAGARLAIDDNNTTGKFTKQHYELVEKVVASVDEAVKAYDELAAAGVKMVVADLPADGILALADRDKDPASLIFNVSAREDSLREENCRANVVHVAPTYSMLADGLAQYLVWKKWPRWLLLTGALPQDKIWADALKRAAERFGGEIVEERVYSSTDTSARTDSGHTQVQRQIPVFTQNAPEHDFVLVADESQIFGQYIPYRTWDPRPVGGSAGLVPTEWDPSHEQWGGWQTQDRFRNMAKRGMRAIDADAWTAVRIIGEGATRARTSDPQQIRDYVLGPKMQIAAYKGEKLTIRSWNHQLRQPILLTDRGTVVSVSPQEGFLHERTELDTLGIDQPETACKF